MTDLEEGARYVIALRGARRMRRWAYARLLGERSCARGIPPFLLGERTGQTMTGTLVKCQAPFCDRNATRRVDWFAPVPATQWFCREHALPFSGGIPGILVRRGWT